MNTLKLTARDFKQSASYWKDYIGETDVTNYDGHIEIEENLGWVRFAAGLSAKGFIIAKAGTGIQAGWGIEAGEGIEAGWGIEAGTGIQAGWGIKAGTGIQAGWGIEAGEGIEAGWGIKAGTGIQAGWGIEAGLSITCKLSLVATIAIFAGVCYWRKITDEEKTITCGKLEGGATVEYGILKETGLPAEERKLTKAEAEALLTEKLGESVKIE